ncbi:MAG: HEPN domain-containing protein [Candidatus Methylomirabilaceae bacterium]
MLHDPARAAETRAWLVRAALDLRAAEFERTGDPRLAADITFHCQQLAEKSMKAFLAWHDRPFRKTHNLIEIGEQCAAIDSGLEPVLRRAAVLTEYAWKFRYPGEPDEPSRDEAEEAFRLARDVHDAIISRLPADVRP